jgi:beta-lactamase class D
MIRKSNINGLASDSIALTEQLRPISKEQLVKKMGTINVEEIKELSMAFWIQNPFVSAAVENKEFLKSELFQRVMG